MTTSEPVTPEPVATRRVFGFTGDATDQSSVIPPSTATVAAIMTRTVYCVEPDVGVDLLARLFAEHGVSGYPVVDEAGRPIGVVTKSDLLRHLHERGIDLVQLRADESATLAELGRGFHPVALDGTTVKDLMMPVVFALGHDDQIAKAAALMAGERVHRLPILDESGRVCGVLSSLDIVRWFANLAGYDVR